jgi:predicted PurR-regulated permease PerM
MGKIKKILYKRFDMQLTPDEDIILKNALANSEELRNEKERIEELRFAIASIEKKEFSNSFDFKLSKTIDLQNETKPASISNGYASLFYSLEYSFKRLIYAFIIILILFFSYKYGKNGSITLKNVFETESISISDAIDPITILAGNLE